MGVQGGVRVRAAVDDVAGRGQGEKRSICTALQASEWEETRALRGLRASQESKEVLVYALQAAVAERFSEADPKDLMLTAAVAIVVSRSTVQCSAVHCTVQLARHALAYLVI